MSSTTETKNVTGRVARVTGPVVDVEFPVDAIPELFFCPTCRSDIARG